VDPAGIDCIPFVVAGPVGDIGWDLLGMYPPPMRGPQVVEDDAIMARTTPGSVSSILPPTLGKVSGHTALEHSA